MSFLFPVSSAFTCLLSVCTFSVPSELSASTASFYCSTHGPTPKRRAGCQYLPRRLSSGGPTPKRRAGCQKQHPASTALPLFSGAPPQSGGRAAKNCDTVFASSDGRFSPTGPWTAARPARFCPDPQTPHCSPPPGQSGPDTFPGASVHPPAAPCPPLSP